MRFCPEMKMLDSEVVQHTVSEVCFFYLCTLMRT